MQSYDAIVRCAAAVSQTPMAALVIVERSRARFAATFGPSWGDDVSLSCPLLAQTIACDDVLIVQNALADNRFAESSVVPGGPRIRAYAGVALHDPDGSVVGVLVVADRRPGNFTTQQIAALRDFGAVASALMLSRREVAVRRLMSRAIEESMDFVVIFDACPPSAGGPFIQYANASFLNALGYTADELNGQSYPVLFAETTSQATVDSIAQSIESLKDLEKEIQLRRKDGSTLWIEFTSRPLFEPDGSPSHWVAVGRDITANRDTLMQTAALVKAIDSVNDHVEIFSLEGDDYALAFQNAAADQQISRITRKLLSDASIRKPLQSGETVIIDKEGIALRPLGNGETVICVRRQPRWIAAAS